MIVKSDAQTTARESRWHDTYQVSASQGNSCGTTIARPSFQHDLHITLMQCGCEAHSIGEGMEQDEPANTYLSSCQENSGQ